MGLIYSAIESSNLMSNMTTNLSLARTTIDQLRTGSQQIVQAVDGKTQLEWYGEKYFNKHIKGTAKEVNENK